MQQITVGKRDFIQHTSKYLNMVEQGCSLTITHRNIPALKLNPIRKKSVKDLRGTIHELVLKEDINQPIFPGFDEW